MSKPRPYEKVNYVGTHVFTLDRRFSDFSIVGQGSYGVVCSANDALLSKKVAIKKISPVAKQIDDAKHVLREIRLMRHLGQHENIVTLEDLIIRETADELYIVMELLDSDLHRVLQSKQPLTNNHLKYFFFQMICGVKYLHDHRIIHRDLKPGNLLVTRDCRLRISDFGLAREKALVLGNVDESAQGEHEPMTEHVITRWYRPPELMLLPDGLYTYAVDMWSCGCILGEMLGRMPMFPGKNFIHQLTLIFDVIGAPQPSEIRHIQNPQAVKYLETQMRKPRVSFSSLYPSAEREALDVMDSLLVFRSEKRATANEVLYSSLYLASLASNPKSASLRFPEITSSEFEFGFERDAKITRQQLKTAIQQEVYTFHNEKFGKEKDKVRAGSRGREPNHKMQTADAVKPTPVPQQQQLHPRIPQTSIPIHRPPPATFREYEHMIDQENKVDAEELMKSTIRDFREREEEEDEKWLASLYAKAQVSLNPQTIPKAIDKFVSPTPEQPKAIPGTILRPQLIHEPASSSNQAIERVTEQLQHQLQFGGSDKRLTVSPPSSPIRPLIPLPVALPSGQSSLGQSTVAVPVKKSIIVSKNIPPAKTITSASPNHELDSKESSKSYSATVLPERQSVNTDVVLVSKNQDISAVQIQPPSTTLRHHIQSNIDDLESSSLEEENITNKIARSTQRNHRYQESTASQQLRKQDYDIEIYGESNNRRGIAVVAEEKNREHAEKNHKLWNGSLRGPRRELDDDRSVSSNSSRRHPIPVERVHELENLQRSAKLKKKKLTVARSPKFSKMSWERKAEAQAQAKAQTEYRVQQGQTLEINKQVRDDAGDAETIFSGTTVSDHHSKRTRNESTTVRRNESKMTSNRSQSAPRQMWKQA